jgi:hypothetical protein
MHHTQKTPPNPSHQNREQKQADHRLQKPGISIPSRHTLSGIRFTPLHHATTKRFDPSKFRRLSSLRPLASSLLPLLLLSLPACGTNPEFPPQNVDGTEHDAAPDESSDLATPSQDTNKKNARALSNVLLGIGAITLIFLIGSYILIRISRRTRGNILKTRPDSTDSTDLWMLHNVVNDDDDDIDHQKRPHHRELDEPDNDDNSFDDGGGDDSCGDGRD